jgi:hypothetical protein
MAVFQAPKNAPIFPKHPRRCSSPKLIHLDSSEAQELRVKLCSPKERSLHDNHQYNLLTHMRQKVVLNLPLGRSSKQIGQSILRPLHLPCAISLNLKF